MFIYFTNVVAVICMGVLLVNIAPSFQTEIGIASRSIMPKRLKM